MKLFVGNSSPLLHTISRHVHYVFDSPSGRGELVGIDFTIPQPLKSSFSQCTIMNDNEPSEPKFLTFGPFEKK